MKYFTPDRCRAFGDHDNEQVFLAAQQGWEDAITAYRGQLARIQAKLPPELYHLITTVYLHDAEVLSMHEEVSSFVITLQPYTTPTRLVVFSYSLAERPVVNTDALPAEERSEPVQWMYDELDLDRPDGETPTFRHDILLSNGWEVSIRFRSVVVSRPLRLLPAAPVAAALEQAAS